MKKVSLIIITLIATLSVSAKILDLNQTLLIDNSVKKGMLSNGMIYYIKSTDVVKNALYTSVLLDILQLLLTEKQ
ncbi:hypothetical protein FIA58_006355 [Flavobacterium jejuense]|uniref:Uncharacterized protein n=1 Tax=Flavobacterium jejuense TaxID=1544455 RepID=A0ABX0IND9_9FLAO|nr:hypothetical protein [Flavobacterium jejuense]NHN25295.1 hypothetical protein [Flavobacterium jejuense]